MHLQSFSGACHLTILCLHFSQFKLEKKLKLVFLSAPLTFRIERSLWGEQRTVMHIVVSLVCHADSSTIPGWTEWVEKGDQFPYIKVFLISVPKSI